MRPTKVTHCICHRRTLEGIAEEAREKGFETVKEVVTKMQVCDVCRRCIPYLRAIMDAHKQRGL